MEPLIIGIAGGTGSGKTTVTQIILRSLDPSSVLALAHDSYYKDLSSFEGKSPDRINFDHPDSFETGLLTNHLRALKQGHTVEQPVYNYSTYQREVRTVLTVPKEVIIVEGILLFADKELRDLMDIKIFIDADGDERLVRRIRRDIAERGRSAESVMTQYMSSVKPMHLEFVEPSKRWADVIIPRGADNLVAIDMVITKIRSMLDLAARQKAPRPA